MLLTLYLPRRTAPPYQTVVYFPPGNGMHKAKSDEVDARWADFVLKSGRAFAFPVYAGTYERSDALASDKPDSTIFWRDHVIMWGKDLRRAMDYLETRTDIDTARFAFYGLSFGGRVGAQMLASNRASKPRCCRSPALRWRRNVLRPTRSTICRASLHRF